MGGWSISGSQEKVEATKEWRLKWCEESKKRWEAGLQEVARKEVEP